MAPGSPPPTRGTHQFLRSAYNYFGITPAYAGNTSFFFFSYSALRDHPRLRGEHLQVTIVSGSI